MLLTRRGQAAVEMVILLAISLVIFSSILQFSTDATGRSDDKVRLAQAQAAVSDLVTAADALYAEGAGAKSEVYLSMPTGLNPDDTYLQSQLANINLYVGGKEYDVPAASKATLCGEMPVTSGGHWVRLEVRESCVHIGTSVLLANPGSLSPLVAPGGAGNYTFNLSNEGNESVNVTLTWDAGDVPATISVGLSPTHMQLAGGASGSANLTVTVPIYERYGTYNGRITAEATRNGEVVDTEVIAVELRALVLYSDITLYPEWWEIGTIAASVDASTTFTVCNNGDEYQIVNLSVNESGAISFRQLTTSVALGQLTLKNATVATALQDDGTNNIGQLNQSNDQNRARINSISATSPHWITINYTATIASTNALAYARVYTEHYEGDASVVPEVLWWDGSTWQAICTLPDRVATPEEGTDSCDLSARVDSISKASNISIRIYYTNPGANKNGDLDSVRVEFGYGTVSEIRGALSNSILTGADAGKCNSTTVYLYTFESDPAGSHLPVISAVGDTGQAISAVSYTVYTTADITPPNVSAVSVNATSVPMNRMVCINATVTDAALSSVWALLSSPSASANYTMTDSGCGGSLGDNVYGAAVVLNANGTWTVQSVYANDTSGNLGNRTAGLSINVSAPAAAHSNYTRAAYWAFDTGTDSTSEDTALANVSDDSQAAVKCGASSTDYYLYANFSFSVGAGESVNSTTFYAEHYEDSQINVRELQWWDGSSWQVVCTLTQRLSDATDSCTLAGVDTIAETQNVPVRIRYQSTSSAKYAYVDYAYVVVAT